LTPSKDVTTQYATSRNLSARSLLHAKYARVDWFGWVRDRISIAAGSCVLDVGCGPGWFWKAQAARMPDGLRLTLLDRSPQLVEDASRNVDGAGRYTEVQCIVGDAIALPFDDRCFDTVVLMHMLYHVEDPTRALAEAARVLRHGGRIFVTTNALDNMGALNAILAQLFPDEGADRGARAFSLDDAELALTPLFGMVRRHDLEDTLDCTDPADVIAYVLSMPPAISASDTQRSDLASLVRAEFGKNRGALRINKHTGIVEAAKLTPQL
jgi:ubiquinone/menaquinone biosynthesis C-methylase UbiE